MDLALEIFDDPLDLLKINYCRLFLDVITMSDVATASGDRIDYRILNGEKPPTINKGLSVCQADPGAAAWIAWDKFMDVIASDGLPHQPLGEWLHTGQNLRRDWQWHCCLDDDLVFESHADGTHTQCDRFGPHCIRSTLAPSRIESHMTPVSVSIHSSSRIEIEHNSGMVARVPSRIPVDFNEFVAAELTTNHYLLEHLELLISPFQIFHYSHESMQVTFEPDDNDLFCDLVSDGSEKDSNMTFGWAMAAPDGTRLARCSGSAPGHGHSHRAESTGLLSGLTFLALLPKIL